MRIDRVFMKLTELRAPDGTTAQELADLLGYSRANVSHELNKLVLDGRAKKKSGKPVRFYSLSHDYDSHSRTISLSDSVNSNNEILHLPVNTPNTINKLSVLGKFSQQNPSLFASIEQAKAAVLYPPHGMNILILGDTGVGKSMFAELLYDFAQENSLVSSEASLITFNCADYANNPQLLLSQLFGSKKGAYTGLDENRIGLIEKAHGGILFLDEVHRLPPEGQEMFFTFIDKGTFRRMGETETLRQADVRIFAATTEKPESHLLRTFTRRFPMVIRLPSLKERTFQERMNLVNYFIRAEANHLNAQLHVSANSLNALMSYSCENNIGQLRADIRFACANAYAEFVSGKKNNITVVSRLLPEHVKSSLLDKLDHRKVWNEFVSVHTKACVFNPQQATEYANENSGDSVYATIHTLFENSSKSGVPADDDIEKVITGYFRDNYNTANKVENYKIEGLISSEIFSLAENVLSFCETELLRTFRIEFRYAMAKHIESALERVKSNKKIQHPNLNNIRIQHPNVFNLALDALRIIERNLEVTLPIDEAGFLATILMYDDVMFSQQVGHTKVLVVMHGESAATSMSNTANQLLGVDIAHGFDLPLDVTPQLITDNIVDFIKGDHHISDVLLLVDMGSLTYIGKIIEERCGIKTRTMQLVSTLHVIEAVQKALAGLEVDHLYNEVLNVFSLLDQSASKVTVEEVVEKKLAILTVCTSGEGAAIVLQGIIQESFSYRKNYLDVIPVEFSSLDSLRSQFNRISETHTIIAAVSPLEILLDVPVFNMRHVSSDAGILELQQLIDLETTARLMQDPLKSMLVNISPENIIPDIRKFIEKSAHCLDITVTSNMTIGITMHIACLFDRLVTVKRPMTKDSDENNNLSEIAHTLKQIISTLSGKYKVPINNSEMEVIARFFRQSSKC